MKKKRLVKVLSIVLVGTMLCGSTEVIASAGTINRNNFKLTFSKDNEYSAEQVEEQDREDISALSDDIVKFVSNVFSAEGLNINVKNNILFQNIIKCYDGTDVIGMNISDETSMLSKLNHGSYSYYVYVNVAGYKVEVTLSKGLPLSEDIKDVLSEEQVHEIFQNVGKWYVSSAGIIKEGNVSLDDALSEYAGKYDNILLLASQTGFDYPVFVGIQDEKASAVMPVYEDEAYEATDILDSNDGIYSFNDAATLALITEKNVTSVESDNSMILSDTTSSRASGYTRQLNVTRQKQEKSSWCWAACARMVGHYITKSAKTQSAIVKNVKGSVINEGASLTEIKKAIQYAVGSKYSVKTYGIVPMVNFVSSIYSQQHPAVIKITWNNGKGHAVVIAGVNSGSNTLYVIDPWESSPSKWMDFNAMCNGTTFVTGTGKYTNVYFVN